MRYIIAIENKSVPTGSKQLINNRIKTTDQGTLRAKQAKHITRDFFQKTGKQHLSKIHLEVIHDQDIIFSKNLNSIVKKP